MGVHDKYIMLDRFGQGSGMIKQSMMDTDSAYASRMNDFRQANEMYPDLAARFTQLKLDLHAWQAESSRNDEPPTSLTPNASLYSLWEASLALIEEDVAPRSYNNLAEEVRFFELAHVSLMPDGSPPLRRSMCGAARSMYSDSRIGTFMWAIGEDILDTFRESVEIWQSKKKIFQANIDNIYDDDQSITSKLPRHAIAAVNMGYLSYIRIGDTSCIVPSDHVARLVDSFKMIRNFSVHLMQTNGGDGVLTKHFMRWSIHIGMQDQAGVGEGFRVARAYYTAKLSQEHALGIDPAESSLDAYEGAKLRSGKYLVQRIANVTESPTVRLELSHGFKYVLDPDIDMVACFKDSEGLREANPLIGNTGETLRCYVMRSLLMSSHHDGRYLRLRELPGKHDPELVRLSQSDEPDLERIRNIPIIRWSSVQFEEDAELKQYQSVPLKVKDKANAVEPNDATHPIETKYDHSRLTGGDPEITEYKRFRKSNDVVDFQKNGKMTTVEEMNARFERIIDQHLRFEQDVLKPGETPEDIPWEKLEKFLFENPKAAHYVLTEPKMGEKYKRYGRIFYIACCAIKGKLSLVELLAKKLSRSQLGNSLVASYRKRQSDKVHLAHATNKQPGGYRGKFVSFDMSAFSQKFPMAAIRIVGDILADLTGDSLLRRLDLIFRSAIVGHSTRGIEGLYAGVLGGFEGFMNFLWTLLHASIMEMALKEAGRSGIVLAYSDDGVLYFLVRNDEDHRAVRRIIERIQEIYRGSGLVFHIGKTLVAGDVMEYLGEVATGGRFMDMGVKAMSKIGIVDVDHSITLFSESVTSICGQARSALSAGCSGTYIMAIIYTEIHRRLKRITGRDDIRPAESLMIMMAPASAGGLGVPCYVQAAIVSEEDTDDWFLYKIIRLSHLCESMCQRTAGYVMKGLVSEDTPTTSMLLGARLETRNKRISSRRLRHQIAKAFAVRARMKLPDDPLSFALASRLQIVLVALEGMPPKTFRELLEAAPMVQEYKNAVAITRSRGASRVLSRRDLREIQSTDTRQVKLAVTRWINALRQGPRYDLVEFLGHLQDRGRRFGFKPLTLPVLSYATIRVGGTVGHDEACMVVQTDLQHGTEEGVGGVEAHIARDLLFFAPTAWKRPAMSSVLAAVTFEGHVPRRFIEIASRMLREDPRLYPHLLQIGEALDVIMPPLPADMHVSLDRLREFSRGKQSIELNIPDVIVARSVTDISFQLKQALHDLGGGMRSLLKASLFAVTAESLSCQGVLNEHDNGDIHRHMIVFSEPHMLREHKFPLRATREPAQRAIPASTLQPEMLRELRTVIRDLIVEMETLELGQIGAERRTWIARMIGWRLSRVIVSALNPRASTIVEGIRSQTDDQYVTRSIAIYALRYAYVSYLGKRRTRHSPPVAQAFIAAMRENADHIPPMILSREILDDLAHHDLPDWILAVKASNTLYKCTGRNVILNQGRWSQRMTYVARRTAQDITRAVYDDDDPLSWDKPLYPDDGPEDTPTASEMVHVLMAIFLIGQSYGQSSWSLDVDLVVAVIILIHEYEYRCGDDERGEYVAEHSSARQIRARVDHMTTDMPRARVVLVNALYSIQPAIVQDDQFVTRMAASRHTPGLGARRHRRSCFADKWRTVARYVEVALGDYLTRHVVVIGRDTYSGPDPESLLHESNDAILGMQPARMPNGEICVARPDEVHAAIPQLQAQIAAAHLLHLTTYLGRVRPEYVSNRGTNHTMASALSAYGITHDSTLNTNRDGHVFVLDQMCPVLADVMNYEYTVFCLGYTCSKRALAAMVALCATYECSLSMTTVLQDDVNVVYLHGAVTDTARERVVYSADADLTYDTADNMIVADAEEHLYSLLVRSGYEADRVGSSMPRRRTALVSRAVGTLSLGRVRSSTVLSNEPYVCAAAALCSTGASASQRIWALALFRSALWGPNGGVGHTPHQEFDGMIEGIGDAMEHPHGRYIIQGMIADVQTLFAFFMYNPVIPSALEGTSELLMTPPDMRIPSDIISRIEHTAVMMEETVPITELAELRRQYVEAVNTGQGITIMELLTRQHAEGYDDEDDSDYEYNYGNDGRRHEV